jgi:predicted nucleotidyltransferase
MKANNKQDVIDRIRRERDRLLSHGVAAIGLFGSFVRGEQTASSDIDILLEFEPEKHTFDNFMEASFLLEEILGRKVEVLTPEGLDPHIGPHILKEVERVHIAV